MDVVETEHHATSRHFTPYTIYHLPASSTNSSTTSSSSTQLYKQFVVRSSNGNPAPLASAIPSSSDLQLLQRELEALSQKAENRAKQLQKDKDILHLDKGVRGREKGHRKEKDRDRERERDRDKDRERETGRG